MLPLDSRNVLVCLRYGIGDLVMELPALSALRAALPEARITGIATPPAHEILDGDPRVDRTVLTSRWDLRHRWDSADEPTRREIAKWVRRQEFDLVLGVQHATMAVGEAIWSLGIRSLESDQDEEAAVIAEGGSGVEAIRAGVRAGWGLPVPEDLEPELRVRPEDRDFASDLLHELGLGGERPFAVSPVASHELKRWPLERFAAVADHVVERRGGPVLVLEGPQAEAGRGLVEAMERSDRAIRVGAHHLLRTAALLERCSGFLCHDTGLMHIAAAAGAPTVGVFGPTRSRLYLPPRTNTAAAVPTGVECSYRETESLSPPDCWKAGHCLIADRSCVHRTRLDDALEAVRRVLEWSDGGEGPVHDPRARRPVGVLRG